MTEVTNDVQERVKRFRDVTVQQLETDIRHWREECGKLDAKRRIAVQALKIARQSIWSGCDTVSALSAIDAAIARTGEAK